MFYDDNIDVNQHVFACLLSTKPEEGDEETASEADPMDAESAEKQGDA